MQNRKEKVSESMEGALEIDKDPEIKIDLS